jgi:hypothetical protein
MPTPYDSRIVKILEALANTVDSYDGLESEIAYEVLNELCIAVVTALPGPEPGKEIRRLYQLGIRNAEDARLDPQPGDTFNDSSQTFTVIARHDDYVVYTWNVNSDKRIAGADASKWKTWKGTFTPGNTAT